MTVARPVADPPTASGTDLPVVLSAAQRIFVVTVCCATVAVVMGTMTGLYPIAADIARNTGATQTETTWIVDAYTLAIAGLLLPAGGLSDRFGRRGMMLIGMAVFTVAALLLLLADTPEQLIGGRVFLGVGAALALPSSLSLITSTLPPEARDRGVALWTASFTLSGGIWPFIAAGLLEFFSWRSSLWLCVVGGAVVLVACFGLPTSREANPAKLDGWGALTGAIAITALVYGLIEAGMKGWSSPWIIGAFVLGLGAAAVFVLLALRRRHPLMDVRLFTIRPVGVSAFAIMIALAAVYGIYFLALQYEQFVLDYDALKATIPPSCMAFGVVPVTLVSIRIARAIGLRGVNVVGCLLGAGCYLMLYLADADTSYWYIIGFFVVMGAATGFNMAPCTAATLRNVSEDKQGVAAAINHTTREIGTALGVALVGGVLSASYREELRTATETLPEPAREASRESIAAALAIADQSGPAGDPLAGAAKDGFIVAMQDVCLVMIILLVVSAVICWFWAPSKAAEQTALAVAPSPTPQPVAGHGLTGSVCSVDGDPLVGAALTLTDLAGNQLARAYTDESGGYALRSPRTGRQLVVCVAPGMSPLAQTVSVNGGSARHDITLDRARDNGHGGVHDLAGVVRTPDGAPVPAAELTVVGENGTALGSATARPDGAYRIDGLPAGSHVLRVRGRVEQTDIVSLP